MPMGNSPVDPHPEWLDRLTDLEASTPKHQDLPEEYMMLSHRMSSTPAQTLAGATAQIEWYLAVFAARAEVERELLHNVLTTLRRLDSATEPERAAPSVATCAPAFEPQV